MTKEKIDPAANWPPEDHVTWDKVVVYVERETLTVHVEGSDKSLCRRVKTMVETGVAVEKVHNDWRDKKLEEIRRGTQDGE